MTAGNMTPFDEFFHDLGEGYRITNLEIFQSLVREATLKSEGLAKLVTHFWQASKSASMVREINEFASEGNTKVANKYLAKKLAAVYAAFELESADSSVTDLERMMGMHVRLQTVPPADIMATWLNQSARHMDDVSPEWHRIAFENFVKLGVYPGDQWIENWWAEGPKDFSTYQPSDLYRIVYRMAVLDFMRQGDESLINQASPCRKAAEEIFEFIEARADKLFPEFINNQVFFAGLWFGKDFVTKFKMAGDDGVNASAFERKVWQHISEHSNVQVSSSGIVVPVTGHKIDLRLVAHGKVFGAEVDGISHFNRIAGSAPHDNAVIYNPSTRFHSWLIAQHLKDVNVLRIPYFMFDEEEAGIPWEKTLGKIARKDGHSIYAWHGGSVSKDMMNTKSAHIFLGCDL